MPAYITSLNSGSNGNCYYIGNDTEAVLIDAGISCRETEKRMERLGLSMNKIRAIFLSHEHADHITGIPAISKKYQIPVYLTPATRNACPIPIESHLIHFLQFPEPVIVGKLTVTAFPKFHDAAEPCSFMITVKNINIGVFTDIGHVCREVAYYFSKCQAAFLETNYSEEMLAKGNYPESLKKRIRGKNGHLSNTEALELFLNHRNKGLNHLILSHLSRNNNSVKMVEDLFQEHATTTKITVASRYKETNVICLDTENSLIKESLKKRPAEIQLSLF